MAIRTLLTALALTLFCTTLAHADLDAFLSDLDVSARGDLAGFKADLGAHFDVSGAQVDLVLRSTRRPGDAAVVFWLGRESRRPIDDVLRTYRRHRGQGWGAVAKSLGIKPGSSAFHDLKRGDLGWSYDHHSGHKPGHGRHKGKKHK
jgi:hypothetical protein